MSLGRVVAPEDVQLGTSGDELGRRIGIAVRDFVKIQWREMATTPPDWRQSLEHLADYCRTQLGALGSSLSSLDAKVRQIDDRVRNLEALEAHRGMVNDAAPHA